MLHAVEHQMCYRGKQLMLNVSHVFALSVQIVDNTFILISYSKDIGCMMQNILFRLLNLRVFIADLVRLYRLCSMNLVIFQKWV